MPTPISCIPTARRHSCALAAVLSAVLLAGCGSSSDSTARTGATSSAASRQTAIKVGLVADVGGLDDRGFNHLAYVGLLRAEQELGVQGRVLTSSTSADYVPNITTLAEQGYNLVIAVGFLMADATDTVAKQFPHTKFAIVDYDATSLPGKPRNVEGLLFEEQQPGYLAGYLAGLYAKAHGYKIISSVGGQKIPPVDEYIAGYQAGAKAADPGITTLNGYSQDFTDQSKCKEVALNQIQQGSKVVFQVAGGCGLGALSAAHQQGVQGIGVDADQSYLGSYILTSAEKRVDVAVFDTIEAVRSGRFAGGRNALNSLANGGVGYGKIGPAGTGYATRLAKVESAVESGQISGIPTTVQ